MHAALSGLRREQAASSESALLANDGSIPSFQHQHTLYTPISPVRAMYYNDGRNRRLERGILPAIGSHPVVQACGRYMPI